MEKCSQEINSVLYNMLGQPHLEEGDYKDEEGYWCCGKCGGRIQFLVKLHTNGPDDEAETLVYSLCPCRKEKVAEEERKQKEEQRQFKVKRYKDLSNYNRKFANATFENAEFEQDKKVVELGRAYVDNFKQVKKNNGGLLLYGNVGTGKTYFSYCIANELMKRGYTVFITNCNAVLRMDQWESEDVYDAVSSCDLFILDDLGSQRDSSYADEIAYNLVDIRYVSNRPMIVTTNLSAENMKKETRIEKNRIYDRIMEICRPLKIDGESKRPRIATKNYQELCKTLFGQAV